MMKNIEMMKNENVMIWRNFVDAYENLNGFGKWFETLDQEVLKDIVNQSYTYLDFLSDLNGTYHHKYLMPMLFEAREE